MKSFVKFILFIVIWMAAYYLIGRLFNWGLNFFVNALNLDTLIGKLILLSVGSSVMWGILFYPTLLLCGLFIDKTIYANISLFLMIIFNVFIFYVFAHYPWYVLVFGIVHAASTIIPLWFVKVHLKDEEYKEQIKTEIINSLQDGNE